MLPVETAQTNAFSLKGVLIQIAANTAGLQQISENEYEVKFGGGAKHLKAIVTAARARQIRLSKTLFVRITQPCKWDSEIEVLGNTIRYEGLDMNASFPVSSIQ